MHKLWSALFGIVMLWAFLLFVAAPFVSGWWLPVDISTYGHRVDFLFYLILWITGITFVATEAVLIYFMYKYAARPGYQRTANADPAASHAFEKKLEIIWTIVPALVLLVIAFAQISAWAEIKYQKNMPKPDGDTQQMEVSARQWEWRVRYPSPARMKSWEGKPDMALDFGSQVHEDDIRTVNEIHTWLSGSPDKPQRVLIHLKTQDVLHSLFFPNLRLKQDAVPGKTIPVWFACTQANTAVSTDANGQKRWVEEEGKIWELACAEYCGARHSLMRGRLFVHKDKADFMAWLEAAQSYQTNHGGPVQTAGR